MEGPTLTDIYNRLARIEEKQDDTKENIGSIKSEIKALKRKSSFWGAISSAAVIVAVYSWEYMKKKVGL